LYDNSSPYKGEVRWGKIHIMDFTQIIKTAIADTLSTITNKTNKMLPPDKEDPDEIGRGFASELHTNLPDFSLSHPTDPTHGDYASNVALILFPRLGEFNSPLPNIKNTTDLASPRALAEHIKEQLIKDSKLMEIVERIEVKGAGFINFFYTPSLSNRRTGTYYHQRGSVWIKRNKYR
jgi:arginyl-tRNA synthetase